MNFRVIRYRLRYSSKVVKPLLSIGRRLDPIAAKWGEWRDDVEIRDRCLALAQINGGNPEDQKYWKWSGMTGNEIRRSAQERISRVNGGAEQ